MAESFDVVTGAFGYSGQYIARRLLDHGRGVRTLTNSPDRSDPFDGQVEIHPFNFDQPDKLKQSLRGATTLYNTYWVRFNHRLFDFDDAVRNTLALFEAAREAGVQRIVHVSITNPSETSPLAYFRGKARLERALKSLGVSYAILRPAVLFGREDILINNIAWMLRRFPVFGVFGNGRYLLSPIYVDDLAQLAVDQGAGSENVTIDAVGPDSFTYRDMVASIGRIIGRSRRIVSVSPGMGHALGWLVGKCVGDVVITKEEIRGLMDGLLWIDSPPAGDTRLMEWAKDHRGELGQRYTSEIGRRKDRVTAYAAR